MSIYLITTEGCSSDTDCARLAFVTVTWMIETWIVAGENAIKHVNLRDGSLSLFLLRFKLSFKATPFLKLLEHCKLFSQYAVQILTSIALQFLYAVTKAWHGFRVALRTLKIVAFLCKLTAGLTLLLTTTCWISFTTEWAQWPLSTTATEFVCFETATDQLAQWPPSNTTWFVSFATTTGQLAQWPRAKEPWLLGLFVLRPQWVSWLNGRQATLLGSFCMRPQRVSWLKYGEQWKTDHVLVDVQGPEMAHASLRLW